MHAALPGARQRQQIRVHGLLVYPLPWIGRLHL